LIRIKILARRFPAPIEIVHDRIFRRKLDMERAMLAGRCRRFTNRISAALIAFGVCQAASAPATAGEAVDLELVLAVDVSGSVDPEEARLQREGYLRALNDPGVIKAIEGAPLGRIAATYVEWAGVGHYKVVVDWRIIDGAASAKAFADALRQAPIERAHRTSISDAILFSLPHFDANDFDGTRRIIDISGDGANNYGKIVSEARDIAVAAGVTINGLPILSGQANSFYPTTPDLDLYFRDCVIGGPGAFYVVANGFEDFARAVRRKLILEVANVVPRKERWRIWRASRPETVPCTIGEFRWLTINPGE
jgi:hypothetical protein